MFERREEQTLRKVHEKNVKAAQEMGISLEDWHAQMSAIGNSGKIEIGRQQTETTVIYNSADYVLSYLFPPNRKKKKK